MALLTNCCDRDSWISILRLLFRISLFLNLVRLRDWAQEQKQVAIGLRHGIADAAWEWPGRDVLVHVLPEPSASRNLANRKQKQ